MAPRKHGSPFAVAAFSLSLSAITAFEPNSGCGFLVSQQNNPRQRLPYIPRFVSTTTDNSDIDRSVPVGDEWKDVLPLEKGSHNSARIKIPSTTALEPEKDNPFDRIHFSKHLESTIQACREMGKSSLWVEVPMDRAGFIEDMGSFGLRFHHAFDQTAVLNLWLLDGDSKIPEYATHNVGVGAVVVNSRDEILCVRELRRNYLPWKTPTGLTELGEQIDEAAIREVLEETGVSCTFHSLLCFRQTHGLKHGRSDLFFVCRLDPIEGVDDTGEPVIPKPVPQESEIECAEWVPLEEYRKMVHNKDTEHPMMQHVLDVFEAERHIEKRVVESVVPGRKPNAIYYPAKPNE